MFNQLFSTINAIAPISKKEFEYFTTLFTPKKLRKRQYLLQEGDICKYQAFVEEGIVRSYTIDEKGEEHVLQFASEGWWIADLSSFLTGEPSFLNIDALENAEMLLISKPNWEQGMKEVPALERYFRIIIQNHLIATQKRLLQSLMETAEEKYNRFLQAYPACAQRLSQRQIAAYLGVSRETLSRIRHHATGK